MATPLKKTVFPVGEVTESWETVMCHRPVRVALHDALRNVPDTLRGTRFTPAGEGTRAALTSGYLTASFRVPIPADAWPTRQIRRVSPRQGLISCAASKR